MMIFLIKGIVGVIDNPRDEEDLKLTNEIWCEIAKKLKMIPLVVHHNENARVGTVTKMYKDDLTNRIYMEGLVDDTEFVDCLCRVAKLYNNTPPTMVFRSLFPSLSLSHNIATYECQHVALTFCGARRDTLITEAEVVVGKKKYYKGTDLYHAMITGSLKARNNLDRPQKLFKDCIATDQDPVFITAEMDNNNHILNDVRNLLEKYSSDQPPQNHHPGHHPAAATMPAYYGTAAPAYYGAPPHHVFDRDDKLDRILHLLDTKTKDTATHDDELPPAKRSKKSDNFEMEKFFKMLNDKANVNDIDQIVAKKRQPDDDMQEKMKCMIESLLDARLKRDAAQQDDSTTKKTDNQQQCEDKPSQKDVERVLLNEIHNEGLNFVH